MWLRGYWGEGEICYLIRVEEIEVDFKEIDWGWIVKEEFCMLC